MNELYTEEDGKKQGRLLDEFVKEFEEKLQLKSWQHKTQCAQCNDIIHSRYSGEYVSCKCGAIAVDQTPHYSRLIGYYEDFKTPDE